MIARAPASSANLGPGFDVLALAVDRYVSVEVEPASRLVVRSSGEGAGMCDDASHLAAKVAMEVARTDRLAISVESQVPVARGLGSSAALAAAAAAAAGSPDPLAVAARVDGHPENAAASCVGGLVAAVSVDGSVQVVPMTLDDDLALVAVIPDRALATSEARRVLPSQIPVGDATFNLGRLAMLVAGLADLSRLGQAAAEDRLHQSFRSALFPEAPSLLVALTDAGAKAACWSGAGPTLVGFSTAADAPAVRTAAEEAMADVGVAGRAVVLRPDTAGLVTGDDAVLPEVDVMGSLGGAAR